MNYRDNWNSLFWVRIKGYEAFILPSWRRFDAANCNGDHIKVKL